MTRRFKIYVKCIPFLLCLSTAVIQGQILKDTATLNLIKTGIGYIYNLQFDNAYEVHRKINQSYPGHPVVYLFKGMITYWENYPLLPASASRASYENDLHTCIGLCEKKHNPADEAEFLLANLCARGLLLLFYADNELSREVFPLATSTYQYIRRAFDYTSIYPDFSFFTGLYDYYREAYPEAHPIYKPLALFFPKGNIEKGFRELETSAKNSIVLKAESSSFLSIICLGYDNDYQQASYFSKALHELYPGNIQFLADYIQSLLLIKQYDEAEILIESANTHENYSYYQAEFTVFNGILQEKKYHDYEQAQQYYNKGAQDLLLFGDFGNDISALAYFGLSRISDSFGDKHNKKIYRKKANDLATFKKVNFDE